jgi:hypothetical protein
VSNRVYQGIRSHTGKPEVYVLENTTRRTLKEQLVLHGPLEFDWGYKGREARDLAIALLADALEGGDDPNVDLLFQRLLDETISALPAEGWQLTQAHLLSWVYGRLHRIPIYPLPLKAIGGGVPGSLN